MQINIVYDSSVNNAPAGFQTDINSAVQYLESLFTNPITITIDVGYGEIDGQTLSSGDLGESYANYATESYSAVRNALIAQNAPGASTLPANSPFLGSLDVTTAEAKALGLMATNNNIDGWVGFSSTVPFSYGNGITPTSNEYDFSGIVEHEITEDMGRVSLLNEQPSDYALADLYRYSSSHVRDLTTGRSSTAYFSIDDGVTNLGNWNNSPRNGDLADWYPSGPVNDGNDAFNDYSNPGVINVFSANDIALLEALGWTSGSTSVPQINAIYQAILQRAPSLPELNGWLTNPNSTDPGIISALVNSPEAQHNVYPVAQVIDLATGHLPTASQLAGWVPYVESNGLLQGQAQTNPLMDQMATAFVASDNFGKMYNNGIDVDPNSPVTAQEMQTIIHAATGVAASQTQVNAWVATGLSIDQVFVDFALGDQYTAASQATIQQYLTAAANGAVGNNASGVSAEASSLTAAQINGVYQAESQHAPATSEINDAVSTVAATVDLSEAQPIADHQIGIAGSAEATIVGSMPAHLLVH